jgi:CHAD domain-containing protein
MAKAASASADARRPPPSAPAPHRIVDLKAAAAPAVRAILAHRARALLRECEAVATTGHPDAVHDLRVAARRLRSAFRAFRPLLRAEGTKLRRGLRALARRLGAVRDLDVFLLGLPAAAAAANVAGNPRVAGFRLALARERRRRFAAAQDWLAAPRGQRLCARLARLADGRGGPRLRRGAAAPLAEVVGAVTARPLRAALAAGRALPARPRAAALHRVRILVKRARYALEPFADVGGALVDDLLGRLVALQDLLGEHQDAVVAALRLAPVAGAGPGALRAVYRERAATLARRFPAAWRRLDRPEALRRALARLRTEFDA